MGDSAELAGMSVGRTEPCPCGSGKKYKKCCGAAMMESGPDAGRNCSRTNETQVGIPVQSAHGL